MAAEPGWSDEEVRRWQIKASRATVNAARTGVVAAIIASATLFLGLLSVNISAEAQKDAAAATVLEAARIGHGRRGGRLSQR